MFENTLAHKRALKKGKMLEELSNATKENKDWKAKQLEGKIFCFDKKHYPKIIWNSNNGTYRKKKEK